MEIKMKTYTVVASYFDENDYYIHYYLATYVDYEEAQKYSKTICEAFNASKVVECTLDEHLMDPRPLNKHTTLDRQSAKSIIKIISQNH